METRGATETQQRINRIIGQLKGISRMVDEKRDCSEVLQQVSAIKKAIDGLSKEIVVTNMCQFLPEKDIDRVEKMIERAINL
jgi:DNA-binding FrmR family transcriptional regulator